MRIRARTDADLDACASVAADVHDVDGYPSFLGEGTFRDFVATDDALGAWVATDHEAVVGHVALRPLSAPGSVAMAARELALDVGQLGFVARLLVSPAARRRGIGARLLDRVVDEAHQRRRHAVLDVVTRDVAAVALYDAVGWHRLGSHTMALRSGDALTLHVYAEP